MPIDVKKGAVVRWDWHIQHGDIYFAVRFTDSEKSHSAEVVKEDHIASHKSEYSVPADGVLSLTYDNSFSWLHGKVLEGNVYVSENWSVCFREKKKP